MQSCVTYWGKARMHVKLVKMHARLSSNLTELWFILHWHRRCVQQCRMSLGHGSTLTWEVQGLKGAEAESCGLALGK